jgi:hypothetical protein
MFSERQEGCCHNRAVPQQQQCLTISNMQKAQSDKQLSWFWKINV